MCGRWTFSGRQEAKSISGRGDRVSSHYYIQRTTKSPRPEIVLASWRPQNVRLPPAKWTFAGPQTGNVRKPSADRPPTVHLVDDCRTTSGRCCSRGAEEFQLGAETSTRVWASAPTETSVFARWRRGNVRKPSANRPPIVHLPSTGWTTSGRFPDIASLRSAKRPLRAPWVDVFRTPEEGRPSAKRVDRLPN